MTWPGAPASSGGFGSSRWETVAPGGPRRRGSERVIPSILLIVGVQLVVQIPLAVWMIASDAETDTIVRVVIVGTLAFYGLVAAFVLWRFGGKEITPVWSSKRALPSALIGVGIGLAMVVPIAALLSLISGRVASDAFALLIASERSTGRIIAAAVLLMVCAPLVEEWLFRGLLAESLRERGRWAALLVSSLLFAIWHLRFAATQYYIVVGLVLAALYLRRGLVASMSAHATFNGTLLLIAVLATHAGAHTIENRNVSLRAPATWRESDAAEQFGAFDTAPLVRGAELAVRGPTRALLVVFQQPTQGTVAADRVAAIVRQSALEASVEDLTPDRSTVRVAAIPAGRAVRFLGSVHHHRAEVVLVPRFGRLWTVVLRTQGSYRAARDFENILKTLSLP